MNLIRKRLIAMLLALALLCTGIPAMQTSAAALEGISPVTPQIVAEDAVFTAEAQVVYVGEVNGNDHMFIFMNDYKMLEYDLDAYDPEDPEQSDYFVRMLEGEAVGLFAQPRAAVMDSTGKLWACGQGAWLFCYDPAAPVSDNNPRKVSVPKGSFVTKDENGNTVSGSAIDNMNLYSLAADNAGNVYFGTSDRGYLGMYHAKTDMVYCISDWLDGDLTDQYGAGIDTYQTGYGGLVIRENSEGVCIYTCLEGNLNKDDRNAHYFVKCSFDPDKPTQKCKIETSLDVYDYISEKDGQYRQISDLGGNYVLLSTNARMSGPVLVDISTMQLVEFSNWTEARGTHGFAAVADGYAYVTARMDGSGMYKIALPATTGAKASVTKLFAGQQLPKTLCRGSGWATIGGKTMLVTYQNNTQNDTVEPVFYDVSNTPQMTVWPAFTKEGSGSTLRNIIASPDRKNLYVGGYGSDRIAQYNVETGEVTALINSYAEQTDSLYWYEGKLYAGNYSDCTITQVDLDAGTATPFFRLNGTIFNQYRAHALTAGGDKVFLGTVPKTGFFGGVLAWYDLETGITYVAAGPTQADVYTAKTHDENGLITNCQWTNCSTGEVTTALEVAGVIPDQVINGMLYKRIGEKEYIIGTTSIYGGSGTAETVAADASAVLFAYDIEAGQVVATCGLKTELGFGETERIEWIDAIAEDPLQPGKFWGVVSNVLFSFNFDGEAFRITKELTVGDRGAYSGGGNRWDHRSIVFDGNYMYAVFPQSGTASGTYMIDRRDVSKNVLLSTATPKQMALGEDGNLYFVYMSADLQMLEIAQYTQPVVAASVQAVIDALPQIRNAENQAQFDAAKALYDALLPQTKALVDISAFTKPYMVDNDAYGDIDTAIAAAASDDKKTVQLTSDAVAGDVILLDGVTLDLNGYTLTVDAMAADGVGDGYVTDSSAGNNGKLLAEKEGVALHSDNPDLPLYDGMAGGYRFFDYKLELHSSTDNVGVGREKFWFKFHFYTDDKCTTQDTDAYDLVSADGSNLEISTDISWQGRFLRTVGFGKADESGELKTERFSAKWAEDATLSRWLYVTVSGLDKVDDGKLTVEPVITANGVVATSGAITYVKDSTPDVDYGWADGIQ